LKIKRIAIGKVDFLRDTASLTIYYNDQLRKITKSASPIQGCSNMNIKNEYRSVVCLIPPGE
jgi:hypothetical protein